MTEEHYNTIKRIGSIIVAIALWFLSLRFSVQGFSIQVPEMVWAGWILGFAVTVIELIFTSENRGRNVTLTALGIFAYTYGVWSNVVGIYASRGATPDGATILNTNMIFSVILGLILEVAPEPLFLWGLLGSDTGEGDFVSSLSRIWNSMQKTPKNYNPDNPGKRPVGRPRKYPQDALDTVSVMTAGGPNYNNMTRLVITSSLASGGRLMWDKNKSQSPVLMRDGRSTPVSRNLVRMMVMDNALVEKKKGEMMIEYLLTGSEPPIRS